jgi:hypothetical protein
VRDSDSIAVLSRSIVDVGLDGKEQLCAGEDYVCMKLSGQISCGIYYAQF